MFLLLGSMGAPITGHLLLASAFSLVDNAVREVLGEHGGGDAQHREAGHYTSEVSYRGHDLS